VNCNLLTKFVFGAISVSIMQTCAAANAPLEPAKIIYLLRQTKVVKPDRALNVAMSQRQAIVLTDRKEKETDNDVKIDAVLIAREIITGFPDDVSRVRVTFQKPGSNRASQIDVTAGDVKAYGSGAMDANSLLNSLDLNDVDYAATSTAGSGSGSGLTVASGPLPDKRLLLLSRIEALKAKGTSVKPFMDLFANIETEAPKASEEQIGKDVSYLADKLAEQEDLYKESRKPGTVGFESGRSKENGNARGNGNGIGSGSGSGIGIAPLSPSQLDALQHRWNNLRDKLDAWRQDGTVVQPLRAVLQRAAKMLAGSPQQQAQAEQLIEQLENAERPPTNRQRFKQF
jgi:hypothetical protein